MQGSVVVLRGPGELREHYQTQAGPRDWNAQRRREAVEDLESCGPEVPADDEACGPEVLPNDRVQNGLAGPAVFKLYGGQAQRNIG